VKKLLQIERVGKDIEKILHLPARSRSRLPKNLFGEQVGEGRALPYNVNRPQ